MENAPLTTARTFARKAALEAQKADLNRTSFESAKEQHELAAGEFANARKETHDQEAIRILELLEAEHRHLAELIKLRSEGPPTPKTAPKHGDNSKPTLSREATSEAETPTISTDSTRTASPVRTRRPPREVSSSITNNLARQRRGLPATPELSTQHAGGRILSQIDRPGYTQRHVSPERARIPAPIVDSRSAISREEVVNSTNENAFSKFYNSYQYVFSKIPAPLIFAGFPLNPEEPPAPEKPAQVKKPEREKTRAPSSDDPDFTKMFSKAAMRAIRDDIGPSFGPQESFYLVPPTGGTVSYAGILSGSGGRPGTSQGIPETIEEDGDEFVDARENLGPPSPRSLRNSRKGVSPSASRDGNRKAAKESQSSGGMKTMEELELENATMRNLLDTQSKRLQMWELSSQSQSMALQQSMRAVRQRPDLPNTISDPTTLERMTSRDSTEGDSDAKAKLKKLEDLLEVEREERLTLEQKNKKMESTIGRYREQWERLKAGARKKESDRKANLEARGKAGESPGDSGIQGEASIG
ncbi:hypothetical protein E2P81_ATG08661 [Venturia nashicola]|uniref:Uncharacterized protein n=1 Tax=Venturia nashicola TaxID=86259 RepID=A0A4Z1NUP5_9PEZI|nr:hypothetical protein E6O75_ATG08852 [Venturia nashicola]TLD20997.1 hypothetical protein E2P81_ATG08661 [Venturia nashicola]